MNLLHTFIGLSILCSVSAIRSSWIIPSERTCRFFINEEFAIDETRCQETCDKYGQPWCNDYAPDGDCYCKKGYTRLTTNGICVRTTSLSCRRRMPPTEATCSRKQNEQLSEWAYDEPCGNTCANYKVPCKIMVPMVMMWSPHCVCKEGFARLPNGKCVAIDDPQCVNLWKPSRQQCIRRGNEVYDTGSACQTTCDDLKPNAGPKMCIMSIVEDCYCPEGKVRYTEGGECVNIADCPA
ncbi:SCO-spondin-like [Bradysia coprophila]|uniref:SCO-spondin-like n=1 Tax=Bradysia coprophila TaxID=38358 RepID=UPI00187DAD94|nr:SCO-spondin-like [Bradysia coprophila]